MFYEDIQIVHTVQQIIEFVGTFAFAISGIRHAAAKHFDWLGVTPFLMTSSLYIICTVLAQVFVIVFSRSLKRLDNAWFAFDTLGLALFTIAGLQKTLACGHPFWVAIVMGCITGAAGGVIRDVLLNNEPVIFHKEIYAMASILGGLVYWLLMYAGFSVGIVAVVTFVIICLVRFLAVKYHISLPILHGEEQE